jgi:hypothetical protein
MKKFLAFALVLAAVTPALAAQTTASFTGKWEGTFTRQRPDGTENTQAIVFNLTQKDNALTGTAGPPDQQTDISKGAVNAGTAAFDVQLPSGQLFKFTLAIVKARLQGDMVGERDGVVVGKAKVDAGKAAPAKAK